MASMQERGGKTLYCGRCDRRYLVPLDQPLNHHRWCILCGTALETHPGGAGEPPASSPLVFAPPPKATPEEPSEG